MSQAPDTRRKAFRIGIAVAVAAFAASAIAVGTGSASAASSWEIVFVSDDVPSNAKSIKIEFDTGDFSCPAMPDPRPKRSIETRAHAFANQGLIVTPFSDGSCGGAGGTTVAPSTQYQFSVDQDVTETDRAQSLVELFVAKESHIFTSSLVF